MAQDGAESTEEFDYDELARRLLLQVVQRLSSLPVEGPEPAEDAGPGGGADSVGYAATNVGTGPFRLAPRVGDRLAISIYYDQRGHDYFTATDLTQHTTQTVRLAAGGINPVFDSARLSAVVGGDRKSVV